MSKYLTETGWEEHETGRERNLKKRIDELEADVAHRVKQMAYDAARIAALETALTEIRDGNQIERRVTIDADPAGNTYEIEEIDGPWARIARIALIRARPAP